MARQIPPDNIGYLIGDVSRRIRIVYDRRVEPLGLTRAQWRALVRLSHAEGCTQTALAAELDIEKPTAGKLVERLEAKGWVERRSDAEDARSKLLYLTPAARPLLEQMSDLADEVLEGIFAGISVADAARLHETLNRIKDNLKGMTDDLAVAEA